MPLIVQSHVTNLTPGMERSTLASAGRSAETNGDRMALGLPGRCVRGRFKHLIRPEQCAADFLAEVHDCARDGGCTTGRLMAARHKEEIMASSYGRCRVATCPNSKKRVLLPALGLCATCYKADLAARKRGQAPVVAEGQTANKSPILAPEEVAAMGAVVSTDGQGDHTGITEEHGDNGVAAGQDMASPVSAQDVTCHDPAAEAAARASDPVEFPVTMADVREIVADVIDESQPFVLAGIEFEPMHERRRTGGNYLTVRAKNIGISVDAAEELGLNDYQFASYTVSKDGLAVAVKFSIEARPKALKISRKTGNIVISAQPLGNRYPGLVGKRGVLEFTGVRGWYVARFGGEVAA